MHHIFSSLNEGNKLTEHEPDVDQPNIGGGRKLLHHTVQYNIGYTTLYVIVPYTHLMKRVVVTSRMDRLTVTAASK